jgi:hypothetical protein
MSTFEYWKRWAELLSYVAVAITAPFALWEFNANNAKERREVAHGVYREVDDKYVDLLKLCLEHTRLDCAAVLLGMPEPPLGPEEVRQQKVLYESSPRTPFWRMFPSDIGVMGSSGLGIAAPPSSQSHGAAPKLGHPASKAFLSVAV